MSEKSRANLTLAIRLLLFAIAVAALAYGHEALAQQFRCYLTGQANVIRQAWHIVALNIVLFLLLLLPLTFRRRARWSEYGLVTAFFVSLFIEMYGFPLTLWLAARYLSAPVVCAANIFEFTFLGVGFGMELAMVYATALITAGTALIAVGWVTLWRHRREPFVTAGIYRFSRHPQYLGFLLIVFGWFLDWPTLITVLFAPLLAALYVRAARQEERALAAAHPDFARYAATTPFLV